MTKREAQQVMQEMESAGWADLLLMKARYTDGRSGWEVVGSLNGELRRFSGAEAWRKQSKAVQP